MSVWWEESEAATKEGSPSCLECIHVYQRGIAAATRLWNHWSDDGSRPPDSAGNSDSGGWRVSLVKYGPVIRERGWAQRCRAAAPRGWLHHWHSPWRGVGWGWGVLNERELEATWLSLEDYLTYTSCPHLLQLPQTINTNTPTSISAFQGREALMRIYCAVVVTMKTPWDLGRIVYLNAS